MTETSPAIWARRITDERRQGLRTGAALRSMFGVADPCKTPSVVVRGFDQDGGVCMAQSVRGGRVPVANVGQWPLRRSAQLMGARR